MTLCKMAVSNIKSNFKNYWAYFLSSSFSVFVLYLFISITYNKNVQNTLGKMKSSMILLKIGLGLVILFSVFFIWYSNSFFIKARKKEFATYMLLGISKKQVAFLNFFENLMITLMSFLSGIILGIVFNKFFIMLLFELMRTKGIAEFQFSLKAFDSSFIVFTIIFCIISIHGHFVISRSSLIDMFNASKKIEKGLKISMLTLAMSVVSFIFMSFGYYLAIKKLGDNIILAPKVVLLIVIGTILFFTAITAVIINIMKKNEPYIFKGIRLIPISQIYQRYRGNVGSLSIITVTTTIALCALLFCFGGFNKSIENARNLCPFSVEYVNGNQNSDKIFNDALKEHKEVSVKNKAVINFVIVTANGPFYNNKSDVSILNQSKFNKINSYEGVNRKVNLNDNECYYVALDTMSGNPKGNINKNISFKFGNKDYNLNITNSDTKNFIAIDHCREIVIVSDKVYKNIKRVARAGNFFNVTGYILKNDFRAEKFTNELQRDMPKEDSLATFYEHYTSGMKIMGVLAFTGLFIGILFVMATGSIIYFKMSMEAKEDKKNFMILRKIGVSKHEIKKAVLIENLILFGVPFLLASLNTYAASFSISKLMELKIVKEYVIIMLAYLFIYSIYYLITVKDYLRTVNE
ncbi:FtsX-like permease family protein [Clostridium guangxiense]|uniref:FtsX-like permease family protein n=1 Tax=Clostridium guangxiense TaxID=1662055 RepID=UPI001E33CACF|nr:ABC transporter permease [Clostridium guangxiense]MCD2348755.1 ABC transporter permease [Clostridium guangxiense]